MSSDFTICVGTVGGGVFHSRDGGENWTMSRIKVPVPPWAPWIRVRFIAVDPANDSHMIAGSDVGIYRSSDRGESWEHLPSPADDGYIHVWAVRFHPTLPGTILIGLAPAAIHRTRDNGATWQELSVPVDPRCVVGSTHITDIVFDPRDPDIVWASVEASGILRSTDGGDTWVHLPDPGPTVQDTDIHGLVVHPSGKLLATTPSGVFTSTDEGQTYTVHKFPIEWPPEPAAVAVGVETYCRGIAMKVDDPDTVFVATGDYVPGKVGGVQVSTDAGLTWAPARMDVIPNSTTYLFATHKADPDRIVAASNYGYIYVSRDAGQNWTKLSREFGEIRGLVWVPN
ncbi:WD40/YVTN/BNR-like repeat-containing protein [Rhizorhabdus argentea]|uniref:WD40/YVTN/BNR-like repeat-containing protein n=1 Tax=Rhizorhabdus argentea TaxID=1387174 RepID=UPI0030EC6602